MILTKHTSIKTFKQVSMAIGFNLEDFAIEWILNWTAGYTFYRPFWAMDFENKSIISFYLDMKLNFVTFQAFFFKKSFLKATRLI